MGRRRHNIEPGTKFGKWTANHDGVSICKGKVRTINCTCTCGRVADVILGTLLSGASRQCYMCASSIHNMTDSATHKTWCSMFARCNNEKNPSYPRYGGRGISVCKEWTDFRVFLADMGERPDGLTLDRIDVNGGYNKENCRWATRRLQANNRRYQRMVSYQGSEYTVADLARLIGRSYNYVWKRVNKGIQIV